MQYFSLYTRTCLGVYEKVRICNVHKFNLKDDTTKRNIIQIKVKSNVEFKTKISSESH